MSRGVQIRRLARPEWPQSDEELFERCWPLVWRTAYTIVGNRAIAEDAAQAAIVNVFRGLRRFDWERPLEPWVRRIAANAAFSELRKQQRQPMLLSNPQLLYRDAEFPADDDSSVELVRAVAALPEARRIVVVLHYWLDYTVAEIADQLDTAQGTIASRLARALNELRLEMEDEQHAHNA
jgi:RNA polymerase sigma factor (sigma-70 family)